MPPLHLQQRTQYSSDWAVKGNAPFHRSEADTFTLWSNDWLVIDTVVSFVEVAGGKALAAIVESAVQDKGELSGRELLLTKRPLLTEAVCKR